MRNSTAKNVSNVQRLKFSILPEIINIIETIFSWNLLMALGRDFYQIVLKTAVKLWSF